jgi:hypothetical protein
MNLTGTIKRISQTQIISDKFQKREFVVTVPDGQYPQHILLEMHKDNCDRLDNLTEGQEVSCEINLRGRRWAAPTGEVKYFNTLVCWKIEAVGGAVNAPQEQVNNNEDQDLPF